MKSSVTWENSHNFQAGIFMASNVGSELSCKRKNKFLNRSNWEVREVNLRKGGKEFVLASLSQKGMPDVSVEPSANGLEGIEKALHMGGPGVDRKAVESQVVVISGLDKSKVQLLQRRMIKEGKESDDRLSPKIAERQCNVHRFELQKRGQGPMKNSGTMGPASNIMIIEAVFKHEVDILEIRNGQSRGEECLADRGKKMWGTVYGQ
ncbi:hypothetical protein B0H17DRAFT_1131240 [Mycena rosella]|uniref:Uncharacterized protein n=1 Tax=Mycena rosella TaxID=1033263 RepID=A0AAD7DP53_MYCRO|nr:hypothetical protein B0H17DRAFT_1131240 [Mycena rosella]